MIELPQRNGESPEFVQTSTAAAMTLKLFPGRFYRKAKLRALNLLLTYKDGCKANCSYCGLSSSRKINEQTFIRVDWPTFALDEVISRVNLYGINLERVCVSMVTHRHAYNDMLSIVKRFRDKTDLRISTLIAPTLIKDREMIEKIKAEGADMCGIAVDCATPELFKALRGSGVRGPHIWEHYWKVVKDAASVFGIYNVSVHFVVGLGETEKEMLRAIQKAYTLGAEAHLFSFYPEAGSTMENHPRPSIGSYRRIQLGRYLIHRGYASVDDFAFDDKEQVKSFGVPENVIEEIIDDGNAFMTSGCRGNGSEVACNRPYGNERPSEKLRNYPFIPNIEDNKDIREQLLDYSF
ncbi:radical SAM superfamily protein [archaeon]|nr:radical SAM superfamily protein [archaeon]